MKNKLTPPGESELEAAMRREFFNKDSTLPASNITSQEEINLDADSSVLAELEQLMRQEFFPQTLALSTRQYLYRSFECKNSIRLFQLNPGSREDPIEGRLICVSFDSKPKYEALSYAWGCSDMDHQILTDEGAIRITASVRSALTRLRLHTQMRVLWIDALCINQKDNDEKSEQILLMPKIYSSASRVVVHLGDESDRSDAVLKLIEKIARTNFSVLPGKFVSDSALPTLGLPHGRAKIWKHFRAFWSRSWFRRIWVVQEFALAKDVTMICGEWEGSWEIFLEASLKINEYRMILLNWDLQVGEQLNASVGSMLMLMMCSQRVAADRAEYIVFRFTNLLEMGDLALKEAEVGDPHLAAMAMNVRSNPDLPKMFSVFRQKKDFDKYAFFGLHRSNPGLRKLKGMPLINVITMIEAAEATDPRDRLFALLSLASDLDEDEVQLLRPLYKEDVRSVVCRYASVLIRKGQCMKILYSAFLEPDYYDLPSWVGNWITPVHPISKKIHIAHQEPQSYKAGGNSTPMARMGDAYDVLIVSGGLVDTIDCVGIGPVMSRTGGPFLPMMANQVLNNVDDIFETLTSYPTGESLFEVKWRTLIGNKTSTTYKVPPTYYGNLYRTWREEIKGKALALTDEQLNAIAPQEYFYALCSVSNSKLCKTRGGYVGLVPTSAKVGDHVSVLPGGIVPFVLRDSAERPGMFRMVGGCYIHGIMQGEALKFPHWHERRLKLH